MAGRRAVAPEPRRLPMTLPPPARPIRAVTLAGRQVRLEPLSPEHHDGLVAAAMDGALWRLWYTSVPEPEAMAEEIARRLGLQEAGSMAPFTVFAEPGGAVAGMTTYMHIDAVNR